MTTRGMRMETLREIDRRIRIVCGVSMELMILGSSWCSIPRRDLLSRNRDL